MAKTIEIKLVLIIIKNDYFKQGRIKGEQRGQFPRPRKGPPRDEIYFFQIKYPFKNIVIQKRYKNTTLYYIPLSIKGPQEQLISLQVWLSASFGNRYWIAYKYF